MGHLRRHGVRHVVVDGVADGVGYLMRHHVRHVVQKLKATLRFSQGDNS